MFGPLRSLFGRAGSLDRVLEYKRQRNRAARRLHVESLEDRRMMAVLIGGGEFGGGDDIESLNDNGPPAGQLIGPDTVMTLTNFGVNRDVEGDDPVDNFRYQAAVSGRLTLSFSSTSGSIRLDVTDELGNSLIGAPISSGVTTTLPVVAGQPYFVSVRETGAVGSGGVYNVEMLNVAAPQPTSIDLAPASDTGLSNTDNITGDTTPTFFIQADLSNFVARGITILNQATIDPNNNGVSDDATDDGGGLYVSLINTTTDAQVQGFANPVGANGFLWTFTSTALTSGDWFVSTAVQMVDAADISGGVGGTQRATGRAQLSDPLIITVQTTVGAAPPAPDLLTASDTGMLGDDNVTNKSQPTFGGTGPANEKVLVFGRVGTGAASLIGQGVVRTDGRWEVTTQPLADGAYNVFVVFEDASGNRTPDGAALAVVVDQVEPNTPFLDLISDTGVSPTDNITTVNRPRFTMQGNATNSGGVNSNINPNDVKYRLYLRPDGALLGSEVLVYDSFALLGGFTTLTSITQNITLTLNNANGIPLPDGKHSFKLEVEDRAGNISPDFLLEVEINAIFVAGATVDLLPSSDSGMLSTDNVTNKMSPAFDGVAAVGSTVRLYANGRLVGQTVAGSDISDVGVGGVGGLGGAAADGFGLWEITTEPLTDGVYNLSLEVEDTSGNIVTINPVLTPGSAFDFEIDTNTPNTPLLDLREDTGFNLADEITSDNTPVVSMTTTDPTILNRLFTDNLKFRIFDRFENNAEFLLYDSAPDAAADAVSTAGDMFTSLTQLTRTLGQQFVALNAGGNFAVTAAGLLVDGVHNLKLEVEDRAGNISPDFLLEVFVDTVAPAAVVPNLSGVSDSGMVNTDNVTNKMSPAFDGVAEINTKVFVYATRISPTTGNPIGPDELIGEGVVGSENSDGAAANGLGRWEVTVEPLIDGVYDISVRFEDAAGNITGLADAAANDLRIVVDTEAPNTPLLDLNSASDTGRNGVDDITLQNTPLVSMTSTDPNIALAQALFTDNLKFRIYDRYVGFAGASVAEFLLYDSAQDAAEDAFNTAADMFTARTIISETLPQQFFTLFGAANAAILNVAGVGRLADGIHNFKLEVEDRAGNISHDFLLPVEVDTVTPPVSFGDPAVAADGLKADSDTGVLADTTTLNDRITKDSTPTFWGIAEADSVVRIFADINTNGVVDAGDVLLGQAVATPFDGNRSFADGYWEINSSIDLNNPALFALRDGLRRILVTAQDVAGNTNLPNDGTLDVQAILDIFVDTQGPQVSGVFVANNRTYDLFDPKPSTDGPTPLVNAIEIDLIDLPARVAGFVYGAVNDQIVTDPGQYKLVGDHVGTIAIQTITFVENNAIGAVGRTTVRLTFFEPLPDDRYTLTLEDSLQDDAGNALDGESNAAEPQEVPFFPSGNIVPGGDFVARFTVDTRPEIGAFIKQNISIDTNGNFVWDPAGGGQIGGDATNRDIQYTLPVGVGAANTIGLGGYNEHDLLFAGKFSRRPANGVSDGFDTLAAYGYSNELNQRRWLVDRNHDGVVNVSQGDILNVQPNLANFNVVSAIPVAGNFVGGAGSDDEIGLYFAGNWAFDTNKNFVIDAGDTFITNNLLGHPIVGDFDGDGFDDAAVFNNNQFFFNFANDGLTDAADQVITWGYPGVLDRPVAADYDRDGIDDIGLWVPRNSSATPRPQAEWYILVSNDAARTRRVTGSAATLNHPYTPIPFGKDLYAEFGDELALPIFGNFDPPVAATPTGVAVAASRAGDFNRDGQVDGNDRAVWAGTFGSRTDLMADGNGNGVVDAGDYSIWADNRAPKPAMSAALTSRTVQVGDYNADGRVGTEDVVLWRSAFGTTSRTADGNGDGVVDAADYSVARDKFGSTNAIASPAPMSPPAAAVAVATFATSAPATTAAVFAAPAPSTPVRLAAAPARRGAFVTPSARDEALLLMAVKPPTRRELASSDSFECRHDEVETEEAAIEWALAELAL